MKCFTSEAASITRETSADIGDIEIYLYSIHSDTTVSSHSPVSGVVGLKSEALPVML